MSVRWLPFVVLVAACSSRVHRPGEEWLAAVRFEGNHVLSNKTLLTGLALHRTLSAGRAPDPYQIQLDADRIRGEYFRRGFLDVDVHPRVDRNGDVATVTYKIEEGPRATTRVAVRGVPQEMVETIRAKLPLRDGAPFDYEKYDQAKEPLLEIVREAGYAHARLDATVLADRTSKVATVQLEFELGPRTRFGKVSISGVAGELANAIQRRLEVEPGAQFSPKAIRETRNALYAMKRFSTVRVAAAPDADPAGAVVPIEVAVVESARHEVKLGGGFGIDPISYEARARVGYSIAGWPFPLDKVAVDLRPAYALLRAGNTFEPRLRAITSLERMDLFATNVTGTVEAGYSYLAVEAYTSYGPLARLGVSMPLGIPELQLRVGWKIERFAFRNLNALVDPMTAMRLGLDHPERNAAYQQAVILDLRDDLLEPHHGGYLEARVSEGTKFAGSAFEYIEVSPEARGYIPLGKATLAGRARYAAIYGDVPATERFYAGGASSQRGFSERRLSPTLFRDVNGKTQSVVFGGAALIDVSAEFRTPIGKIRSIPFGGVAFLDGGDVTDSRSAIDPLNLHWAAGVGVRIYTIVGPVRFDFARRINRTGPGEPEPGTKYAFHLSLGEAY